MIAEKAGLVGTLTGAFVPSIRVNTLALAFLKLCGDGAPKEILENDEVFQLGNAAGNVVS